MALPQGTWHTGSVLGLVCPVSVSYDWVRLQLFMAACTVVEADRSPGYTSHVAGMLSSQPATTVLVLIFQNMIFLHFRINMLHSMYLAQVKGNSTWLGCMSTKHYEILFIKEGQQSTVWYIMWLCMMTSFPMEFTLLLLVLLKPMALLTTACEQVEVDHFHWINIICRSVFPLWFMLLSHRSLTGPRDVYS